jgi:4'-phosphopantetheinyl transferase
MTAHAAVLGRGEVHIWTADLKVSLDRASQLSGLLAPDEQSRACRFLDARRRGRSVASRGILRELLAGYLDEPPDRISITTGRAGKPRLDRHRWLKFSVSHAGDRALFAFARDREIGVDIERIAPARASTAVAAHFFSSRERSAIANLSPDQRTRAFFTCWSRKEALVKATGEGMSAALESIEVYPTPTSVAGWYVEDVPVGDLHAAAVALAGSAVPVSGSFAALPSGKGPAARARAEECVVEAAASELEREADVPRGDSFSA